MTLHKITTTYIIDDEKSEREIEDKSDALEELDKAVGTLPATVYIEHVEYDGEESE